MDNPQATTDFEIGWLAGIIDGEGWLGMTICVRSGRPHVLGRQPYAVKCELKITNCDEAIIERSAAILAKLGVNVHRRTHKSLGPQRRPVHECSCKHMTGMEKILPTLLPHLTGIKHERATLILRFIELRRTAVGTVRPGWDEGHGRRGPRTIYPYSAEELAIVVACRALQSLGASETTRANRDNAIKALTRDHALMRTTWSHLPDKI